VTGPRLCRVIGKWDEERFLPPTAGTSGPAGADRLLAPGVVRSPHQPSARGGGGRRIGSDILREFDQNALAAICARYGVAERSVSGPAARGELPDDCEIDLLAECDGGRSVTLFTLIDLQTESM